MELFAARKGNVEFEEESVELSFGQRIGAFALKRILRGEYEEWLIELIRGDGDGDAQPAVDGSVRLRARLPATEYAPKTL